MPCVAARCPLTPRHDTPFPPPGGQVTGVSMTEKSLQKAFVQHGVIKFGAVGDAFDPAMHDALYSIPGAFMARGSWLVAHGSKLMASNRQGRSQAPTLAPSSLLLLQKNKFQFQKLPKNQLKKDLPKLSSAQKHNLL